MLPERARLKGSLGKGRVQWDQSLSWQAQGGQVKWAQLGQPERPPQA